MYMSPSPVTKRSVGWLTINSSSTMIIVPKIGPTMVPSLFFFLNNRGPPELSPFPPPAPLPTPRACRYCYVHSGKPDGPPDPLEPLRLAATAAKMGLSHVVVTSVDRDDLPDKGAGHYAATRSEEHTSELQSQSNLVCRLLLEKKK